MGALIGRRIERVRGSGRARVDAVVLEDVRLEPLEVTALQEARRHDAVGIDVVCPAAAARGLRPGVIFVMGMVVSSRGRRG